MAGGEPGGRTFSRITLISRVVGSGRRSGGTRAAGDGGCAFSGLALPGEALRQGEAPLPVVEARGSKVACRIYPVGSGALHAAADELVAKHRRSDRGGGHEQAARQRLDDAGTRSENEVASQRDRDAEEQPADDRPRAEGEKLRKPFRTNVAHGRNGEHECEGTEDVEQSHQENREP